MEDKPRGVRLTDEVHKMALADAKALGLNFSNYIRFLIIKANKEK